MEEITLKVTYQEYLIIRHSLERYADRWVADIRELSAILASEDASTEIKERCKAEMLEVDKIRIATQRTWDKVTKQAASKQNI